MNIIKYLRKANIEAEYNDKKKIFTFELEGQKICLSRKEIEQYLFVCLVDLIKDEITV